MAFGARMAFREQMDISVVLPVVNECANLRALIPRLHSILEREKLSHEIIVVDGNSADGTPEAACSLGARVVAERERGYAGALKTGFAEARGDYVLTLDADLSHEPDFVARMWRARTRADIVVASRYVPGGVAYTSFLRRKLSAVLNFALRRMLSMPVRDLSSGFRLYRREALGELRLDSRNFEVLEEVLVKAYARGFSVAEVPFTYFPRETGRSHARLLRFGIDLVRAALRLWKLRNSPDSADYDERAFYSLIPLQRYWHRRRHQVTLSWARGAQRVLSAGCISTVIVESLNNAVAMDSAFARLRYLRRLGMPLVQGSACALPFRDGAFDCVVSAQVIEHLPLAESLFAEMRRVLKADGTLIIGTPDCATLGWRLLEPLYGLLVPSANRREHVSRYTRAGLEEILARHGFAVGDAAYIAASEMILKCRKTEPPGEARHIGAGEVRAPATAVPVPSPSVSVPSPPGRG